MCHRENSAQLMGREFGGLEFLGGQWLKLAIARGFYMNRKILVLDEPNSVLDPLAERKLYREFFEQAGDKTIIVITHRIASAIWANKLRGVSHAYLLTTKFLMFWVFFYIAILST